MCCSETVFASGICANRYFKKCYFCRGVGTGDKVRGINGDGWSRKSLGITDLHLESRLVPVDTSIAAEVSSSCGNLACHLLNGLTLPCNPTWFPLHARPFVYSHIPPSPLEGWLLALRGPKPLILQSSQPGVFLAVPFDKAGLSFTAALKQSEAFVLSDSRNSWGLV